LGKRGIHIDYWWKSLKNSLGRTRRKWIDNIKMDLGGVGWMLQNGLNWHRIGVGGRKLSVSIKCWEIF
jgi:hypothetical protein